MNDNLIALLEELNSYGCAYIELSSEQVIEVAIDDDAGFTRLRPKRSSRTAASVK